MEMFYLETDVNRYGFAVYPVGTVFGSVSGVYVLLASRASTTGDSSYLCLDGRQVGMTGYEILYIGMAGSFRYRFYHHPTFLQAGKEGMSHIGILKVSSGRKRRKIERELVGFFEPPMNRYLL